MPDLWMDVDAALSEVPINIMPLLDDADFKTREESVAFNAAGLDLVWNFVSTGGVMTQTAVTPTNTGGDYDWVNQGNGFYSIEIPASGGASINNDTEGFGWFSGVATGVLPWRGPTIGFRSAGLNNKLIDDAYSTTRGLAGTALPDAAADAAGGLPISDAGGLDLDGRLDAAVSSRLAPTVAARTLDVTAGGAAGVDWGNVENPTTAVNLSATNIDVDQVVASVSGAVGSVTAGVTLAASAIQAIWDALTSALTTVGSIGKLLVDNINATISSRASQTTADAIEADTQDIQSRLPAALVSGRIDASVGAMAANTLTASALATDAVNEVVDQVWDEAISGHLGAGSTGAALNAAGSAGDPWSTPLPGAYGAGTAGKIIGDNVDTPISSRLAPTVAGRTLDVSAGGEAGLDWANIGSPTTAQNLSGTNIDVDQVVASVSGAVGSVTGAVGSVTGNVGGNVVGSVGSVTGSVTVGTNNDKTGYALSSAGDNAVADALLDRSAGVETNRTPRQALRLMLSALAGKLSGAATTTVAIRDTNDTKNRITATVDADGNRTAVSYDQS
jgi:hypothetical protein